MYLHHAHWTIALRAALERREQRAPLTRAGARPIVAERLGASPERLFTETLERIHPGWQNVAMP